jgi:hypothetical protein
MYKNSVLYFWIIEYIAIEWDKSSILYTQQYKNSVFYVVRAEKL